MLGDSRPDAGVDERYAVTLEFGANGHPSVTLTGGDATLGQCLSGRLSRLTLRNSDAAGARTTFTLRAAVRQED